ncbi:Dynein regulatory complex subunit 4 [Acropora cervicornis]|uniref:Dynein regulatory complex subunit 4 n=1 Tax=Acropora cervicornis TaxID=6130 RepID=A0AAD9PSA1_ACRCE|nr:Dynein regulatory complex subunit 4 [Acropora cervicornis]
MPPKKKSGKKKGKKKSAKSKTPTIVDGISTEEMSKEQLEEHIVRLREELDREREERNYFQLERDKVTTFWEITKRQHEERKAELRNKDREMEEAEERHQVEIKVYKQKVKHLLYEHQNNIAEQKAESAVQLKLAQDEHQSNEQDLRKDKRSLKVELKEQELSHEDVVKNLKRGHDEHVTKLRQDFERQVKEIESKYDKKMKALREELELRRKTEIHEIEERKNGQINTLMKNHEKAFSDIKNYYNDITLNNLALINSLKEQVEEMKKKEERMEKQLNEIMAENKRLTEPLQKAREESAKARLKVQDEELRSLHWEHEVLQQRFSQTQSERDELYGKFVKAIHEVQQKSNFKNLLLEKKLSALADTLEKKVRFQILVSTCMQTHKRRKSMKTQKEQIRLFKLFFITQEAQLNEVLSASNLDPTALTVVTRKLEDVLDSKNSAIKDLQYELARVCKAHNDLIRTYEAKLQSFGVPTEELGFKPLESNVGGQQLGRGPAGLVAAPT